MAGKFFYYIIGLVAEAFIAFAAVLVYIFLVSVLYDFAGIVVGLVTAAFLLLYGEKFHADVKKLPSQLHDHLVSSDHVVRAVIIMLLVFTGLFDFDRDGLPTYAELLPASSQVHSKWLPKIDLRSLSNPFIFDTNGDLFSDGVARRSLALSRADITPSSGLVIPHFPTACTIFRKSTPEECHQWLNVVHSDCLLKMNAGKVVETIRGELVICEDLNRRYDLAPEQHPFTRRIDFLVELVEN